MNKIFIIVFFSIISINLYSNGIPLSTVSDTNSYPYMKGRQMINVNFSTGYAGFLTGFLNAVTYDFEITSNFAKLNFNNMGINSALSLFMLNMNFKASMWYIPNVAYTFLYKPNLGFEFSMGVQSMSFSIVSPQNKASKFGDNANNITGDLSFYSSYTYIPITFGVKLFTGKNRKLVNTFRIGFEPVVYTLKSKNSVNGITTTTDKTYRNFNMYISYELGWSIELFPTREWAVKPYFDISLFEIGYYVKSSSHILYRDTMEHFRNFAKGTSLLGFIDDYIPTLQSAPYLPYVMGIRFILLPRIGFSIRF